MIFWARFNTALAHVVSAILRVAAPAEDALRCAVRVLRRRGKGAP